MENSGYHKTMSKHGFLGKTPSIYTVMFLYSPLPSLNIKEKSQGPQFS